MSTTADLITVLKRELKTAGITYAQLAVALGMAESSIKRMLSQGDMPLSRIDAICQVLRTDFAELARRTPAWAAEITGLSVEQIVQFARLYGGARRSFLRVGYGFSRQRNGAAAMHAVSCLPAVTGAWQWPGGGALYSNSGLYGLNTRALYGLDAVTPDTRVLDMGRLGAVLAGERRDLGDGPPVSVLLVPASLAISRPPSTTVTEPLP